MDDGQYLKFKLLFDEEMDALKLTVNDVPFEQLDFRSASLAPTTLEAVEQGWVTINVKLLSSDWILLEDLKKKLQSVQVTQVVFVDLVCSS